MGSRQDKFIYRIGEKTPPSYPLLGDVAYLTEPLLYKYLQAGVPAISIGASSRFQMWTPSKFDKMPEHTKLDVAHPEIKPQQHCVTSGPQKRLPNGGASDASFHLNHDYDISTTMPAFTRNNGIYNLVAHTNKLRPNLGNSDLYQQYFD